MYLVAILLPPIAVLICGKPIQAIINLLLCCFFLIPGIIHAIFVVNEYKADKRVERLKSTIDVTTGEDKSVEKKSSIAAFIVLGAIIAMVLFFILMEFLYN